MSRVLIDTNVLIALLEPRTPADVRARLDGLLDFVVANRGQLLIPAPVLAEYLTGAGGAASPILQRLLSHRYVQIVSFDHVAAVETAMMHKVANGKGNKRWPLDRKALWQKVKVDTQIVAIAKAHGASMVAEDIDLLAIALGAGIQCKKIQDLPIPESARQLHLDGVAPAASGLAPAGGPPTVPPKAATPGTPM